MELWGWRCGDGGAAREGVVGVVVVLLFLNLFNFKSFTINNL